MRSEKCSGWLFPFGIEDNSLVLDIRHAIAEFFAVPPTKIHPNDALDEYQYKVFDPWLHRFVIARVLEKRQRGVGRFWFPEQPLKDLGDFAQEIQRVVGLSRSNEN